MTKEEISEHYTSIALEAIASKLPEPDAKKMYKAMESIARIIVGKAAFCAACATDPTMKELAKQHLDEASLWADFLAEQTKA